MTEEKTKRCQYKRCRDCNEQIDTSAVKCKHCGSYQNWQRRLHLSNTVIALLIALVSVSTQFVQYVYSVTKKDNSSVVMLLQGVDSQKISVLASNIGTRPALVEDGSLYVYTDESEKTVLSLSAAVSGAGNRGLPESEKKEVHLHIPRFGFRANKERLLRLFNYANAKVQIVLSVVNYDGTKKTFEFDGRGRDYSEFVESEWNRKRSQ